MKLKVDEYILMVEEYEVKVKEYIVEVNEYISGGQRIHHTYLSLRNT